MVAEANGLNVSKNKIFGRWSFLGAFSACALLALSFLGGCASFYPPVTEEQFNAQFSSGRPPVSTTVQIDGRAIHYVDTNEEAKPLVVFIHGAPGAWDAFSEFLKDPDLVKVARLVSVDRPGYGRSELGTPERSLAVQAQLISHVFKHNQPGGGAILVGHSFGGPVAAQLAVDFPQQVAGLVLVAASVDPALEKTKWYQIPAHWKLFSWAVPRDLYSTNEEILPLAKELKMLEPRWIEIEVPVVVLQGGRDTLVPKENADFLARMLDPEIVSIRKYPKLNHFIPWSNPQLIRDAILELLSSRENASRVRTHDE